MASWDEENSDDDSDDDWQFDIDSFQAKCAQDAEFFETQAQLLLNGLFKAPNKKRVAFHLPAGMWEQRCIVNAPFPMTDDEWADSFRLSRPGVDWLVSEIESHSGLRSAGTDIYFICQNSWVNR